MLIFSAWPPHTSLAKSRFLLRNRLRYQDFFFLPFSVLMLLSESADNLLVDPVFGDSNFLYHLGFLYNDDAGLQSGLFKDNVLRERPFSLSNGWPTDKVHIDDVIVGCDRNLGDGGQNGFKLFGVDGDHIFGAFDDFDKLLVAFCSFGEADLSLRLRGIGCGVRESLSVASMDAFCGCGGCCIDGINSDGASISVTVIFGIGV